MNNAIIGILLVTFFSALGGWLLAAKKPVEKPVKAMLFVGYFWLLAFLQLLIIALSYYLWHNSP